MRSSSPSPRTTGVGSLLLAIAGFIAWGGFLRDVDPVTALLDGATIGLGGILSLVAFISVNRYRDRRIAFAGMGLAALGLIGVVGLVDQVWGAIPSGDLGAVPALVLLIAETFLYLSLVVPRVRGKAAAATSSGA